jgi:hypothetical protein
MRIPFTMRILLVLAGLACLIGPALLMRERGNTAVRPTSSPSGAIVSGDTGIIVVRTGAQSR